MRLLIRIFCLFFYFSYVQPAIGFEESNEPGLTLSGVINTTLIHQPDIKIYQKNIDIQKGVVQTEKGKFDMILGASIGYTHSDYDDPKDVWLDRMAGNEASYGVGLEKQFRSGVTVRPGLEMSRTDIEDYPYDPKKNIDVSFLVTIPLLQGRGWEVNAADEVAAERNLEVSIFETRHHISEITFEAISSYWNYLAMKKNLVQLKASEERAELLVKETKIMIQAGKLSPSEIEPITANFADKTAFRIAGNQSFLEAKQSIGLIMGESFHRIIALPDPCDPFPLPDAKKMENLEGQFNGFMQLALKKRADYLASRTKQQIGKILIKAAENKLLNQIDLNIDLGYSGIDIDDKIYHYISPWAEGASGTSASFTIDWQWPVNKNIAWGNLIREKSYYSRYVIETRNLERKIHSAIFIALKALQRSASELAKAQDAVSSYKRAVENEKEKFRLGISTLNDIISMEDRLTDSLLNEISAQLKYANALARLRFETGALLSFEKNADPSIVSGTISLIKIF